MSIEVIITKEEVYKAVDQLRKLIDMRYLNFLNEIENEFNISLKEFMKYGQAIGFKGALKAYVSMEMFKEGLMEDFTKKRRKDGKKSDEN